MKWHDWIKGGNSIIRFSIKYGKRLSVQGAEGVEITVGQIDGPVLVRVAHPDGGRHDNDTIL